MIIPAILFTAGTCEEAIGFYTKTLNAKLLNIHYAEEAPENSEYHKTGNEGKFVMHAELDICGIRINAADGSSAAEPGNMFVFNLFLETDNEVVAAFNRLSAGGKVIAEPAKQFWASMYCEVTDRYGISWQILTAE